MKTIVGRFRVWLANLLGLTERLNRVNAELREINRRLEEWGKLTEVGVDVHMKEIAGEDTFVVVASDVRGGTVKVFHMRVDNLHNLRSLHEWLENTFQPYRITYDTMPGIEEFVSRELKGKHR